MREHEVPTHVQAEDKALLWFTFPQIVAVVATCAVAYGVYRYFPFGPSGLKLGIAIVLGVTGIAMTVGKVGGRGLPLVAADLLKFNLGARRYAGCPAELAISEPPPQLEARPDPLRLLAKKAAGKIGKAVRAARKKGRPPFRPHSWFGKGRRSRDADANRPRTEREIVKHRRPWSRFLPVAGVGAVAVLALVLLPNIALADDPEDEPEDETEERPYGDAWRLDEIYFVPPDPVPGRRVFIEGISVSGNHANVTLRAAHELHLRGRAYGGRSGRTLRMGFNTAMSAGHSKSYNLSLDGPSPSFTFSWVDALGRSGAVSLKSNQIPYPLPQADWELCDLELTSLEWTPGSITGVIASECIAETRQELDLPVYGGHFSQSVPALLDASVTGITGTVSVSAGSNATSATFVQGGETRFTLAVPDGKAVHDLEITAALTAALNVPLPPMLQTTHHPARTDVYTRRVTCRCGESSTVKTVRIYVHHPEHVRAVETERGPVTPTRTESIALAPAPVTGQVRPLGLGADVPYAGLVVPPPTPEPPRAEQTTVGDSSWWGFPW
ncbi:MAG: hypothetical protein F4Y04_01455 [Chloroflexi bacterium]|nr:hypothetical protein [Chloroflexota bacterium]